MTYRGSVRLADREVEFKIQFIIAFEKNLNLEKLKQLIRPHLSEVKGVVTVGYCNEKDHRRFFFECEHEAEIEKIRKAATDLENELKQAIRMSELFGMKED